MNPTKLILAASLCCFGVVPLAGCPDQAKNDSIEEANKGVQAFKEESWETAISHFEKATAKYPGNHQAWYSMGQVYGRKQAWKKAADAFQEAAKHNKSDSMYQLWLGVARYEYEFEQAHKKGGTGKFGDLSGAEAALDEAVKLNKDLFRAYWYLGRIYRDTDRPTKAAEAWTTACKLNPLFGKPFVRLGELYLTWDKIDEAIRVLSQGKQFVADPEDKTNVYYYLGMSYDAKARENPDNAKEMWDKAIEAYSKALDERSDNDHAKFQRGLAYVRKGDKSKAEADLQAFLKRGTGTAFDKQEATKAMYSMSEAPSGFPGQ